MNNSTPAYPDSFLEPENMIKLYSLGAFPMARGKESEIIDWYMPEIRTVIPLDHYNLPRSLKKVLSAEDYEIRYDYDYLSVIHHCAEREETWISPKLINAYKKLFSRGNLHTVEVYRDNEQAGGLYGITSNGAFFGESMFSVISQASKIALAHLLRHLNEKGFVLLDVQYMTKHLAMFGAKEIPLNKYNALLDLSQTVNPAF
jgi:leucyl/phenylalanyl-tRNA--protein transferase